MASNEYLESEIIECNRQASEEALSGNTENNALFNCNLSDIYHLQPGDTIQMESAMINARGCGTQGRPIDIKGQVLNKSNTINYTTKTQELPDALNSIPGSLFERFSNGDETYELESNKASIVIGYYKSANAHNMVWQPRRSFDRNGKFADDMEFAPDVAEDFRNKDDFPSFLSKGHTYFERDTNGSNGEGFRAGVAPDYEARYSRTRCCLMGDFRMLVKPTVGSVDPFSSYKPKQDNARYTIFVRRVNTFAVPKEAYTGKGDSVLYRGMPVMFDLSPANNYINENQDPATGVVNALGDRKENETPMYVRFKEKVEIEMPAGFNSGDFIADEITRQLQQIRDSKSFEFRDFVQSEPNTIYPTPVSKTVTTNTYKPFSVASCYAMKHTVFDTFSSAYNRPFNTTAGVYDPIFGNRNNADTVNQSTYISNYNYIGIKRPELYETGFHVNIVDETERGVLGGEIGGFFTNWDGKKGDGTGGNGMGTPVGNFGINSINTPIILDARYTKTNLAKYKAFLDAQAKYPEIWDDVSVDFTGYTDELTVDNSRFLHMNRYRNEVMTNCAGLSPSSNHTTASDVLGTNPSFLFTDISTLGSDGYEKSDYLAERAGIGKSKTFIGGDLGEFDTLQSLMTFWQYKPETKDIYYDDPIFDESDEANPIYQLTYGMFGKFIDSDNDFGRGVNYEFIIIYPTPHVDNTAVPTDGSVANAVEYNKFLTNASGVKARYPARYMSYRDPTLGYPLLSHLMETDTKIGYDIHFNAPTTVVTTPMNGTPESPYPRSNSFTLKNFTTCEANVTATGTVPATDPNGPNQKNAFSPSGIPPSGVQDETPAQDSWTATQYPLPKFDMTQFLYQMYMGSPEPKLVFDGNHFNLQGLHNPENIGNDNDSSYPLSSAPDRDVAADTVVYKLNPTEQYLDYTPDRAPMNNNPPQLFSKNVATQNRYQGPQPLMNQNRKTFLGQRYGQDTQDPSHPAVDPFFNRGPGSADTSQKYQMLNYNLIPWQVYDSKGGIFIEDFGYTRDTWDEGIWGILGFTYDQFHGLTNTRLERIDSDNVNSLSVVTTNAEIIATDSKDWVTNPMGDPIYTDNTCSSQTYILRTETTTDDVANQGTRFGYTCQQTLMANYPALSIKTVSMKLVAQRLPLSMVRGYYGVRCDIVPKSQFLGGVEHSRLPLLGICPKTNAIGDFFYTGQSDMLFTMDKHVRLSNVRIQITDPDGTDARIDDESTILIKVSRKKKAIYNQVAYIQQMMEQEELQAQQAQGK